MCRWLSKTIPTVSPSRRNNPPRAGRLRSPRVPFSSNPACSPAPAGLFASLETVMSDNHPITTENQPSPVPAVDLMAWLEKDREHAYRADELLPANKTVLFNALAAAGITFVIVTFDGYGDSGQIENIEIRAGDEIIELPDERIEILDPIWGSSEIERQTHTLGEAIEHMAYAFLRQTHEGWENNDGAYGDFTFDVEERTITLDYNERYTSSENYGHEF
jgi:hypothetical protein